MKKIIKAELWDKMQFLFRNYYDRMVHAVLYYDGPIDINILKEVLIGITEKVPVLHSSFEQNAINPFWVVRDYKIDEVLTVKDSDDLEADIEAFITQSIPVTSNVQYRVAVFNKDKKATFCMIVNHMCFDGGDFKYLLTKLAENYNSFLKGEKKINIKTGSRSYTAVYTKLNEKDEKTAKGLYKNISQVKDKHIFPLTKETESDKSMIIRRKLSMELFDPFYKIGKALDVTVNDLMLAVYVRALYDIGEIPVDETLTIPCMVDLRRYIVNRGEEFGLTNHTGFMQCSTAGKGETINDTLINVLKSVKKSKRDRFMGLYSLPLLKLAYTVFPHALSEFAIKIGYLNPLIGMSNIGILDTSKLGLGKTNMTDGFMTGAVKYKPYMQLAMTTVKKEVTMTVAIRGNEKDKIIVNKFFDYLIQNVKDFIDLNRDKLK